jgi:diguanylate cyclase (GGDEF)-like protein
MSAFMSCAVLLILVVSHRITYLQEGSRINETASAITKDLTQAVGESRLALNTLAAPGRGSMGQDSLFDSEYASSVLTDNPGIVSLGRFENLKGFTHFAARSRRTVESDLVNDAALSDVLKAALKDAIVSKSIATIQTPNIWPEKSHYVFFQPGYRYEDMSAPVEQRQASLFGGYWVSLNVDNVLTGFYANSETAHIRTQVVLSDPSRFGKPTVDAISGAALTDFQAEFPAARELWFSSFFSPVTDTRWVIAGNRAVEISVKGTPGFTTASMLLLVFMLVFLFTSWLVFVSVVFIRRRATHQDMQALSAITQERAQAERTFNSISECVIAIDDQLNITYLNSAASRMVAFNNEAVIGQSILRIARLYDIDNTGDLFDLQAALETLAIGESKQVDVTLHDKNHVAQSMLLSIANTSENQFHASRYTLVLRDVSAERALTRELEYQANHDSLTGVWNRYYFEKRLVTLIDEARKKNLTHALVYMDLDQFKIVNDTCGHAAGDRLLKGLTTNLASVLRPGDVLARLGGDEFGLLVINATHDQGVKVARRIYDFFQNSVFCHDGNAFPVRASIGYVPINKSSRDISDVLSAADIACYTAKDAGRNGLNVYSEENAHIVQRHQDMNWLSRLQQALKENHFKLLVQAVADCRTKEIKHYEFLLRLRKPDGVIVTPMQFIQAAERYDLMKDIDRWVIKAATEQIAEFHNALGGHCSYSINLSGQSAADQTLLPFIQECLTNTGVSPSCVWFEITETAAITHFHVAVELIQKLKSMGSKVALDDFGSGLSSFGYLKNLPVDIIKIDGQFVKNLDSDCIDREMVRAIHRVAQTMDITAVAEFVETEEALQQLAEIGVDLAQGYHIARPCTIQEAIDQHEDKLLEHSVKRFGGFSSAA